MIGAEQAAILGTIQGLTEFLPVSSSGHLALGQHLLGLREPEVFFDIVLHLGTLVAVILYYRRELWQILKSLLPKSGEGKDFFTVNGWLQQEQRRFVLLLIVGTLPTGLIGILGKDTFESAFGSLQAVGVFFVITAGLLISTYFTRRKAIGDLHFGRALLIGIVQGMAILPGISRSGSTIAAAMALGVEPERAARYSFLLSIPAILGALLLKMRDVSLDELDVGIFILGFFVSAIVGWLALWLLIALIRKGRLHWFAPWCAGMGILAWIVM